MRDSDLLTPYLCVLFTILMLTYPCAYQPHVLNNSARIGSSIGYKGDVWEKRPRIEFHQRSNHSK